MRSTIALALATSLIAVSVAYAADLKPFQQEAKDKFEKQAKSFVSDINTACGTKLESIASDFENFDAKNFTRSQPGTVCSELVYDLKEICKSEPYKKVLISKIKSVSCLTKPSPGPVLEVTGTTLVHHMNQDKSASGSTGINIIKAFLDK